jgi:hypothetical protein
LQLRSLAVHPQNPEAWLKKECVVRQLSVSLDQHLAPPGARLGSASSLSSGGEAAGPLGDPGPAGDGGTLLTLGSSSFTAGGPTAHSYQPLLRVAQIGASALLPAFSWLEVRA